MTLFFVRWPMDVEADVADRHLTCPHCEDDWVSLDDPDSAIIERTHQQRRCQSAAHGSIGRGRQMPSEGPDTKIRVALVADLFCGAGGSSTGARRALARLGFHMKLVAVNHWNVAIETHSLNHSEARHYCQDVNTVKPTEVAPEGKLDLLMASSTCTYHSRAPADRGSGVLGPRPAPVRGPLPGFCRT